MCKERGIKISSAKYVEKQCLIDKLLCFGKHEDTARCGTCPDEGTCKCETKYKEEENEKNK